MSDEWQDIAYYYDDLYVKPEHYRLEATKTVALIEKYKRSEGKELLDLACDLGMASLIEVHEAETLARLQTAVGFPNDKRSLLGINNRNLKIQQTDLSTTEALAQMVGRGTVLVSESGIRTREDVERLIHAGAHALLIGETFMRASDIGAKITELLGPLPAA